MALIRTDSGGVLGRPTFYLCGESEVELSGPEAAVYLPQINGFFGAVSVLLGHLG
ncbi:hypothetical protein ACWGDX_13310 [Streptomyces sp. NPDC055025]